MKRFILKIALFFVLVAVIDVVSGFAFKEMVGHAKYGETYNSNYIGNICADDIIILGSSHADRHYVPSVITDSLGLSCYNCGEPGCGIIPAYARYKMVAERKKPLLVVYEATPRYDYFVSDDYSKYLGRVRQYSDKKPVAEMYEAFGDELEPFRLMSNMYRNNSSIICNVMDLVVPTKDYRGYGPLYGELTEEAIAQDAEKQVEKDTKPHAIDSLKLYYVEKLFADVKADGVQMLCIISPQFKVTSDLEMDDYQPVIQLCKKYDVPFINNIWYDGITGERELFQDFGHLNDKGARKYTASLIPLFRKYLKINVRGHFRPYSVP